MPLERTQLKTLRYLKNELPPELIKRGKLLLNQGEVTFDFYDEELETFYFLVKGNVEPYYQVFIDLMDNDWVKDEEFFDEEPFDCNCVYYMENFECKHVAAALLYLDTNKDKEYASESNKDFNPVQEISSEVGPPILTEKKLNFPLVIPCGQHEIPSLSEKMTMVPDISVQAWLNNIIILKNGFHYEVEIQGRLHDLSVEYSSGNITINGFNKLEHQVRLGLQWLKMRFKNPQIKELTFLNTAQREQAMKEYLIRFGLQDQIKDPLKALSFVYSEGEVILIPKGPIRGFYDVDRVSKSMEQNLFAPFRDADEKLTATGTSSEWGLYNAAFALVKDYRGKFEKILPFMAKGSKNDPKALKVKFTLLEDPDDIRLGNNPDLESILMVANRLNMALKTKDFQIIHALFGEFLRLASEYSLFAFQGNGRDTLYPKKSNFKQPIQVLNAKLVLKIQKEGLLYDVLVILKSNEQEFLLEEISDQLESNSTYVTLLNQSLFYLRTPMEMKVLEFLRDFPVLQVVERELDDLVNKILWPMSKNVEIIDESGVFNESNGNGVLNRELYISELTGLVIFRPLVKYGENAYSNPLEGNSIMDPDTRTLYLRDEEVEDEYLAFLRDLHPSFQRGGGQGFFHLTHDAFMNNLWFMKAFEILKKRGIRVLGLDKINIKKFSPFPPKISMEFGSSQDWFEVNAQVVFGNNKVKLKDIKKAFEKNNNFVELADGTLGILPEDWVKKFNRLFRTGETNKENIKISKAHFNLLDDLPELVNYPGISQEIEEKKERFRKFTEIQQTTVPKQLNATLRNYQFAGLNWLNFLLEYGWGGILADDMGLGKTLQLIAMICKLVENNKNRVLVVVPTTLLFNWKNELEKFAPHIDYFIHHGNRYDSVKELSKHQVILTSYGLVINDLELLKQIEFDAIIADESQAIKNTHSQRYKAITKLKGKFKVALTGTPIENDLVELYAQMNFVNPGFFKNFKGFKDNYLLPLKKGNTEMLSELQRKIQPFILRRTKKEVLTELPEKTEEYLYCEMNTEQRKIYDAYRNEYRDFLLKKFEEEGSESSKMYVLEGLTRLRQVCDSTDLVPNNEGKSASTKMETLLEHITEKTGNHKVLVFSQFVKMLDIVQEKFKENQIEYNYLDGKTSLKEREARVNQFQNDDTKRVFLISLKAGGTGLNLTAADYVYILDPWWNPAVENQAIDRCYRMGQEKHVMAYRMVCTNTIEEKIMLLQQAKTKMAKEVIAEGDSFLGSLDGDGMLALFD
ncbi:SNF2-related protein [uncultured Cyclobacterium sp.]|uniref:DEAD/DEAH box helicase n=1 Tax=uncultured Cyclobacterium sp. TaxID=453820 RepID=UPI0030EF632D|tara:strand:- start:51696 stop:55457 length:3762 start_codon:yes stop_codon:yes gene_type:complete